MLEELGPGPYSYKSRTLPYTTAMPFASLELSRRLERAEGYACAQCASARRRLFPASGAEWMEHAGTCATFDGVDSPITQTFGLGLFQDLIPGDLDVIEQFFLHRGAPVFHEVSPFAGVEALDLLCARNYRPIELSNVLYRAVEQSIIEVQGEIKVRVIGPGEAKLWTEISARGWAHDHPELRDFLLEMGSISSAREGTLCFLAELNGQPAAAGALCLHEGIALLGGAATVPEMRRRGLQTALLHERLRVAFDQGCDLAMMAARPGSDSQRNAERRGFRVAYTRTKWQLRSPGS
jgi:GNAT superfamily N-acetyltransferase